MIKLKGLNQKQVAELLPKGLILLGYRGSIAHGMYDDPNKAPDSIDDKDIMGVFVNPLDHYFGLKEKDHHEQFIGCWDAVSYEVRKFFRLLIKANPNVLSLLWLDERFYIFRTKAGQMIIENRDLFLTKTIYKSFTGYAYSQFHKMKAFTFNGYMGHKRKKLVEKHGYDTKNAAHLIRLLRMGIEFLNDGTLYVYREDAPQLLDIKHGAWTIDQVKGEANRLFERAERAYDNCKLPVSVNKDKVDELLVNIIQTDLFDD